MAGAGETVDADAVIVALSHRRAAGVLPGEAIAGCEWPHALGDSPIVNLHVVYDRRVCEFPFAAGVGSPVQYVFDRSDALEGPGQYLAISISGAFIEMDETRDALRDRYLPALEELFPAARARASSASSSRASTRRPSAPRRAWRGCVPRRARPCPA